MGLSRVRWALAAALAGVALAATVQALRTYLAHDLTVGVLAVAALAITLGVGLGSLGWARLRIGRELAALRATPAGGELFEARRRRLQAIKTAGVRPDREAIAATTAAEEAGRAYFGRYLVATTVLIGLVGTFAGLMETLGKVSPLLGEKDGGALALLAAPLAGLHVTFGASLVAILATLALALAQGDLVLHEELALAALEDRTTHELCAQLWPPADEPAERTLRAVEELQKTLGAAVVKAVEGSAKRIAEHARGENERAAGALTTTAATVEKEIARLCATVAGAMEAGARTQSAALAEAAARQAAALERAATAIGAQLGEASARMLGELRADVTGVLERSSATATAAVSAAMASTEEAVRRSMAATEATLRATAASDQEALRAATASTEAMLNATSARTEETLRAATASTEAMLNATSARTEETLRAATASTEAMLNATSARTEETLRAATATTGEALRAGTASTEAMLNATTARAEETLRATTALAEETLRTTLGELRGTLAPLFSSEATSLEAVRAALAEAGGRIEGAAARLGELTTSVEGLAREQTAAFDRNGQQVLAALDRNGQQVLAAFDRAIVGGGAALDGAATTLATAAHELHAGAALFAPRMAALSAELAALSREVALLAARGAEGELGAVVLGELERLGSGVDRLTELLRLAGSPAQLGAAEVTAPAAAAELAAEPDVPSEEAPS